MFWKKKEPGPTAWLVRPITLTAILVVAAIFVTLHLEAPPNTALMVQQAGDAVSSEISQGIQETASIRSMASFAALIGLVFIWLPPLRKKLKNAS